MAAVRSLGLVEPSALTYLISEGILPLDPPRSAYRWHSYLNKPADKSDLAEDEILIATTCVVWSRFGVIKRVLNLSLDDGPIVQAFATSFPHGNNDGVTAGLLEEALVVVLKTQVQILLLSGGSHIVPLTFEAQSAFACPTGFLLQRKATVDHDETKDPAVIFQHDLSTINESQTTIRTSSARPSLILPTVNNAVESNVQHNRGVPRTFSCIDPMSELGLVVAGSTDKVRSLEDCQALPVDEDLVYLSRYDELLSYGVDHVPLCLAVTHNVGSGEISIWHVAEDVPMSTRTKSKSQKHGRKSTRSQRKSSNVFGRPSVNPASTVRDPHPLRQSFGGLAQSYADNIQTSGSEQKSTADLVDQLGPEFEQAGVQTRSSRRVSSMLARTDLGAGNDRNTFNELALGQANRKSMNRTARRGESTGSFGDRQSFGTRRKSSFHAATSILSTGTSFLNVPGHVQLDLNASPLDNAAVEMLGPSNLSRDLGFFKLTSFSLSDGVEYGVAPEFDVLVFPSPATAAADTLVLSICVCERRLDKIAIVTANVNPASSSRASTKTRIKAVSIRRGDEVSGACLVTHGSRQRLLVLTKTRQDEPILHLEAPWSPPYRLELPTIYVVTSPSRQRISGTASRDRDADGRRMIPASSFQISSVRQLGMDGKIVVLNDSGAAQLLRVELDPTDALVSSILAMCNHIFGPQFQDAFLVAFWEVQRWLKNRDTSDSSDWVALVITLFSCAVPFIDEKAFKVGTPSRRKKGALLRSSSGTAVDLSNYNEMQESHSYLLPPQALGVAWKWMADEQHNELSQPPSARSPRHVRASSLQTALNDSLERGNSFIVGCIALAREFAQSPAGEGAIGPEGYLPISINKDRNIRQTALPKLIVGLHLLREEYQLRSCRDAASQSFSSLPAVLAQLGTWLGWTSWTMDEGSYYSSGLSSEYWLLEKSQIDGFVRPQPPFEPPSILQRVCATIVGRQSKPFPSLDLVAALESTSLSNEPSNAVQELTPYSCIVLTLLEAGLQSRGPEVLVKQVAQCADPSTLLQSAPDAIAAVFHQAIAAVRVTGGDTAKFLSRSISSATFHSSHLPGLAAHSATKDQHHASTAAFESEHVQRWDSSSEADRQIVTKVIFQADRRFQEASRLVNQTRPPVVECIPEPGWTEADLLEAQKELAQLVAGRTLSVASGRAMMHFGARVPLLTERVPIPAFSLQCLMTSRNASESTQPMTFSADKSSLTEEKVCWAFFHNGASSGLMISKDAQCIDTSWILYNKPQELTNRHAGFLLALGLNGHLRSLAKWVAFKYLTPKHTMTSIGLLLGLSASYLGTQDQLITRLLSVHVTRLLPIGAAELNLSPLTQTTGIMGIGLLYYNAQHRRMSEIMLSELENNDSEEGTAEELVLRDEGYRLAAGFALGLINLGQGKKLHGLHDMSVPERLLSIAVGTKNVNMVHVLDRATAGAVMAVAFIFMKTNDTATARKIDIPDTIHQFDYVRPDIFLLRSLARHLIMWDSIAATQSFVTESLPKQYRHRSALHKTHSLATEDLPFYNVLAGICFAIGLRYAGSQRLDVRDLLLVYLDQFLRLSKLPCLHYDARVTLNNVRNCLGIVALATSTVMAGSGDIEVLRRLRSLHGRTDKDTPFGSHMAAHMAIGALFLGGGTMTFGTSSLAVASLCIAFYPLFPGDVLDNKTHLQALRHLWVLAVEGRCLICKEKDAGNLIGGIEGQVMLKDGQNVTVRSPGLLPELESIKEIRIQGDGWWHVLLNFEQKEVLENFKKHGVVNVSLARKAAYNSGTSGDLLFQELRTLDTLNMTGKGGIPSRNADLADRTHPNAQPSDENPFEWLFSLNSLKDFDSKERSLLLDPYDSASGQLLADSAVDSRLEIERGLLPDSEADAVSKDKLWQVRALLQWFDRFDKEDEEMDKANSDEVRWGSGLWVRREIVERVRSRVWEMMNAQ